MKLEKVTASTFPSAAPRVDPIAMLDRLGAILEHGLRSFEERIGAGQPLNLDDRDYFAILLKFIEMRRALPAPPQSGGELDMSRLSLDELRTWKLLLLKARVDDSPDVPPLLRQ